MEVVRREDKEWWKNRIAYNEPSLRVRLRTIFNTHSRILQQRIGAKKELDRL